MTDFNLFMLCLAFVSGMALLVDPNNATICLASFAVSYVLMLFIEWVIKRKKGGNK